MPEHAETRTVELSVLRQALGQWLWNNQIINNGADDAAHEGNPDGLGASGDIPNVSHFLKYLWENYPTKQ